MLRSDRVFGLVVILGALAYIVSASQLQTSFLSDPMGSKTFPYMMGGIALICGLVMILRPDEEPDWPGAGPMFKIGLSVLAMVAYAYALKPMGFLVPTALAAGVLSYLISPRVGPAIVTGIGLSGGLFLIFKYALGLGLVPFPKGLF
jgi:putative tricarboxylic transport membrane protein